VQGQLLAAAPAPPPADRAASSRTEASGKVTPAHCLRCAPPRYPQLGHAVWIRGDVVLHAFIDKKGRIQDITLLAAPSAGLAQAAIQAVSGWIYQPEMLNGRPIEIETQIRVHFTLPR
jgi:protein TonB